MCVVCHFISLMFTHESCSSECLYTLKKNVWRNYNVFYLEVILTCLKMCFDWNRLLRKKSLFTALVCHSNSETNTVNESTIFCSCTFWRKNKTLPFFVSSCLLGSIDLLLALSRHLFAMHRAQNSPKSKNIKTVSLWWNDWSW